MPNQIEEESLFKFLGTWGLSFAIGAAAWVAIACALLALIAIYIPWIGSCPWRSAPTLETAQPLALLELATLAKRNQVDIHRLALKEIRTPPWNDHAVWEFVFQRNDDVERPRLASVYVDRCRNTHSWIDPYDDWP